MGIEASPFGWSKKSSGAIGICEVCQNKAEIHRFHDDSRQMCEDCHKTIGNAPMVNPIPTEPQMTSTIAQEVTFTSYTHSLGEKEKYLEIIRRMAKSEFKKSVIDDLVSKGVLYYDFDNIIRNERWFTVLDLRRLSEILEPPRKRRPRTLTVVKPERKVKTNGRRKRRAASTAAGSESDTSDTLCTD